MHTLGDILNVVMEGGRDGVIVSAISRKAKLSHYATLEKCAKLVSAGLVEPKKTLQNRVFIITEKGLNFVQEYRKFNDLIKAVNLRF